MRALLPFVLVLCFAFPANSQDITVTVETVLGPGSTIDDALVLAADGALYGSRFGTFTVPGTTVTRVDLSDNSTSIFATGLNNSNGLGFDVEGNLYIANYGDASVEKVTPAGVRTTYATAASGVLSGLLVHPQTGVIYVTNCVNNTVDVVNSDGTLTSLATNDSNPPELNCPVGMAVDDDGALYVSNFSDGKIMLVSDVGALTEIADLVGPRNNTTGFITYGGGSLFATGIGSHVIEAISLPDGTVTVLAGTGVAGSTDGAGDIAQFSAPNGIVASADGDTLYVSEYGTQSLRRIVRTTVTSVTPDDVEVGGKLAVAVYPNPFITDATIEFDLPESQHVSVVVYNVIGREVSTLTDRIWPAGLHTLSLSGELLVPGTYFIQLRDGRRSATTGLVMSR